MKNQWTLKYSFNSLLRIRLHAVGAKDLLRKTCLMRSIIFPQKIFKKSVYTLLPFYTL